MVMIFNVLVFQVWLADVAVMLILREKQIRHLMDLKMKMFNILKLYFGAFSLNILNGTAYTIHLFCYNSLHTLHIFAMFELRMNISETTNSCNELRGICCTLNLVRLHVCRYIVVM